MTGYLRLTWLKFCFALEIRGSSTSVSLVNENFNYRQLPGQQRGNSDRRFVGERQAERAEASPKTGSLKKEQ